MHHLNLPLQVWHTSLTSLDNDLLLSGENLHRDPADPVDVLHETLSQTTEDDASALFLLYAAARTGWCTSYMSGKIQVTEHECVTSWRRRTWPKPNQDSTSTDWDGTRHTAASLSDNSCTSPDLVLLRTWHLTYVLSLSASLSHTHLVAQIWKSLAGSSYRSTVEDRGGSSGEESESWKMCFALPARKWGGE